MFIVCNVCLSVQCSTNVLIVWILLKMCCLVLIYTYHAKYTCAFLKKRQTIQCTIDKNIKVAYHFLYVTSNICESLGNESVIALLHLQKKKFLDSVVQLQETFCYFDKQQELQKNHHNPFFNVALMHLNVLLIVTYFAVRDHFCQNFGDLICEKAPLAVKIPQKQFCIDMN